MKSYPDKSQKAIEASPEVRAFIYQQINEFENYLPAGSSVGVTLHEARDHILATIEIHNGAAKFKCHGVGQDPIEALVDAKNALVGQLQAITDISAEEEKVTVKPPRIHRYRH